MIEPFECALQGASKFELFSSELLHFESCFNCKKKKNCNYFAYFPKLLRLGRTGKGKKMHVEIKLGAKKQI